MKVNKLCIFLYLSWLKCLDLFLYKVYGGDNLKAKKSIVLQLKQMIQIILSKTTTIFCSSFDKICILKVWYSISKFFFCSWKAISSLCQCEYYKQHIYSSDLLSPSLLHWFSLVSTKWEMCEFWGGQCSQV